MNENEKTLKALSLIAAELHIQNHISIAVVRGFKPKHSIVSEILIPKLADHFRAYFDGGVFAPGSVMPTDVITGD